ncbi:MAG: redoxin domain-containing protein [Planctomycetes bacterium]|nr:redoxin domain-containing protein [Planctomycetota bacterium]
MRRLPLPLALFALACLAGPARPDAPMVTDKLNKKIDNFTLFSPGGKSFALHDLKDVRAVVVVFVSFDCPVSTSYAAPLAELHHSYAQKGVVFVAAGFEGEAELARHAGDFKVPFPVLRDRDFAAADLLKASTTPEAFVLDHNFVLRYRGRIDNGYVARLKKAPVTTRHDLREALDELLAGKPVSKPVTPSVGCPISREKEEKKTGKVTYYREVLPILQKNCQQCHRAGEVGPFSLMTYKQAVNWSGDIKEYTRSGKMPPWKPVDGPAFHNARKMSPKEIDTLAAWVDEGTPQGDPNDAPPPATFTSGWQLGKPDLVLETGEMTVGPGGRDLFRCFVLPTHLTEDKIVTAIEVRPSNPRVVHHTLHFLDQTGRGRELEKKEKDRPKTGKEQDVGPGYSNAMGVGFRAQRGLAGWAPGQRARRLPEGTGYFLPKEADVVVQVHYHRTGRVEKDSTKIGLYFAKKPVQKQFQGMVIPGRFLFIPKGAEHYKVEGAIEVLQDCTLHSVMPHMHMLGKEVKVTITPPDGTAKTLIAIKDWDYNWQETYFLEQPLRLKAGTRLSVEAFYDNSEKNPNNPNNPPKMVFLGEQTDNEMLFVFLGATSEQKGRIRFRPINKDGTPLQLRRLGGN